ncbi:hypothetical protein [Cylindrospermum stagnale]|uniref:hypothetical protein n=1 Tax=Cylindrospermum stagnale TaxID=142864 RepID=UPI00059DC609|nr:hypothetical protein [Cylindrospermum stagnale]
MSLPIGYFFNWKSLSPKQQIEEFRKKADEIFKNYKLQHTCKSHAEFSTKKRNFLFYDYKLHPEKDAYYFVGDRRDKVQFSFKDACHLRQIVAVNGSKLIFRELLPTMDVDFVRTGQSTVIPFPFKYIREYKNFGVAE